MSCRTSRSRRTPSSSAAAGRPRLRTADEHRELFEEYVGQLELTPELDGLGESMRYALAGGGKRIRPVLCLAVGDALGVEPVELLPAAAALELVHSFSLVHDDLPALDDDAVRRGRPSAHVRFGEATAILAGDALLAEAYRLALSYGTPDVARELGRSTLAMIGGQYLDVSGGEPDLEALDRLKTGALFGACIGCALAVAGVSPGEQAAWRQFAGEIGLLFQLVDDVLDEDGHVLTLGVDGTRRLAEQALRRADDCLDRVAVDTSVLRGIARGLLERTS